MLEKLADHNDALLEQLLMDEGPDRETVFTDLAKETGAGQIVPVLFGSATGTQGIRRLMKALRHEAPAPDVAAARLGASGACAFVFKVSHGGAMGRVSFARIFGGSLKEGQELKSSAGEAVRIGTLFGVQGEKTATQRGRHKKQSGGHGQFGDCVIEVKPLARGGGFKFEDKITGGVIPKQWIPAVEAGVRDAMVKGPLGFPVVDVAVLLIDGSYHTVDSSDIAFRTAGRIGMAEALAAAAPHLLEPVQKVTITVPRNAAPKATSAVASRRGQMLGMAPREGWSRWDRI